MWSTVLAAAGVLTVLVLQGHGRRQWLAGRSTSLADAWLCHHRIAPCGHRVAAGCLTVGCWSHGVGLACSFRVMLLAVAWV